jgi:hypothetical protein
MINEPKNLYERDYYLWQQKELAALTNRDSDRLDWENLILEIAEVGKNQQRALKNYTQRLIEHILFLKYWESEKTRNLPHWRIEVRNFREQIIDLLADSPSLKNYLEQNYADWYEKSVLKMNQEFSIEDETIIAVSKILSPDFFG